MCCPDHSGSVFLERPSGESSSKYSVGYYRGRRRVVIGWFIRFEDAETFVKSARIRFPWCRFDILKSLF